MSSRSRGKKYSGAYPMGHSDMADDDYPSTCVDILEELASDAVATFDSTPPWTQKRSPRGGDLPEFGVPKRKRSRAVARWHHLAMSPFRRFNPLTLLQLRGQRQVYASVPDRDIDPEQRTVGESRRRTSSSVGSALRSTSNGLQGAKQSISSSKSLPVRARRRPGFYKVPNKVMRNVCWVFIACILLFMLNLVRMAHVSNNSPGRFRPPSGPPTWEAFPFLAGYYGGIRTLIPAKENVPEYPPLDITATGTAANARRGLPESKVFHPYPDYASKDYLAEFEAVHECFLDANNTVRIPKVRAYDGIPAGMPDPIFGSYNLLGIRDDICFERYGRLGPYGFGYTVEKGGVGTGLRGDREGSEEVWKEAGQVDFQGADWADAQRRCAAANAHRFKPVKTRNGGLYMAGMDGAHIAPISEENTTKTSGSKKKLPRTAFVVRTWSDYRYTDSDIINIRSLVTELSLHSSGEIEVHLLVHVKDLSLAIFSSPAVYETTLNSSVPEEFRGMATLWSESQMSVIYPGLQETNFRDLPVHGAYRGLFMALQYFSQTHREYDYFWHWEMDIRYTGHVYHLLDRVINWADSQPRKGLWERNERFYIPTVHGTYLEFSALAERESSLPLPDGTPAPPPIWGPLRPSSPADHFHPESDPLPPYATVSDASKWGISEPADLITLNPIFNPVSTGWLLTDDYTGYNTTPPNTPPPRRIAILSASRLSRRLLDMMHAEMAEAKHALFTEMFPATMALHHGLKAVYAPHPVLVDRVWPIPFLTQTFNAGPRGEAGSSPKSVFNSDNEHNFRGMSWYFNSGFAGTLWRRWLGVENVEGLEGWEWEAREGGRVCLRGLLVHPIKT